MTALFVIAAQWRTATAEAVSDDEILLISQRHCVSCHARNPTHESFKEAPKNVTLETVAELKRYAEPIFVQTVQNRAMPLGQTEMTDDERDKIGAWVQALK